MNVHSDLLRPQARLSALDEQWQFLVNKSAEKSQKLKEANKQQNFNTGIKDFDFWLSEVPAASQSVSAATAVQYPQEGPTVCSVVLRWTLSSPLKTTAKIWPQSTTC